MEDDRTAPPALLRAFDEGVCTLTLNRPHRLNALSGDLIAALSATLDEVEEDDSVRVLVVTGAPRLDGRPCFCAGADMKEMALGGAGALGEREYDLVREAGAFAGGDHL